MKRNKVLKSILVFSLLLTLVSCSVEELEKETGSSLSEDSSSAPVESNDSEESDSSSEENSNSSSSSGDDGNDPVVPNPGSDSDTDLDPNPEPEKEVDLTGNPTDIDHILDRVNVTNNYSIQIEYIEKYSDTYTAVPDTYSLNHTRHYLVDINYTDEAALLTYYQVTSILSFEFTTWFFTELYVNTEDGKADVYWSNSSSTDLYFVSTRSHPWQYYFWSLVDMNDYRDIFIENGTYYDDTYGEYINYIISPASVFQFEYIVVQILFGGGNYLVDDFYVHGPTNVTILYENYYDIPYSCNYYKETGEWITSLESETSGWVDSQTGEIWYENDIMYSTVYDVSHTSIPDSYASYLD